MKLEFAILEHLREVDNGTFVDISQIQDDYEGLQRTVEKLRGRNLILVDDKKRDFGAFGIQNRKRSIKARINMNGRAYLHTIKKQMGADESKEQGSRKNWSLSYFFSF